LLTGAIAAFACGLAAYYAMGRFPGLLAGGVVLAICVPLCAFAAAAGFPSMAHMPDSKLTFSAGRMRSRGALARTVPVAALAAIAPAYLAATAGLSNAVFSWRSVPLWHDAVFWACVLLGTLLGPAASGR
jgi:hypothetical protein